MAHENDETKGILTPKAIVELRARHNLSQRQLANMLGVSEVTIARWEKIGSNHKPSGAAENILLTLLMEDKIKEAKSKQDVMALLSAGGGIVAGFAIWKLLNEIFGD